MSLPKGLPALGLRRPRLLILLSHDNRANVGWLIKYISFCLGVKAFLTKLDLSVCHLCPMCLF